MLRSIGLSLALLSLFALRAPTAQAQKPPLQNAPAQQRGMVPQQRGQQQQSSGDLHAAFIVEGGWRWVAIGMDSIPRAKKEFPMAYHAGLRLDLGGGGGNFYLAGRFDGYAPTGYGTFPWQAQVRVGMSFNDRYFDRGGLQSSTSRNLVNTNCGIYTCTNTYRTQTNYWWEPSGWVNGLRYFYAAGHLYDGTEVMHGQRPTQMAGSVGVGLGIVETKFTTWFAETEVLFFPGDQWADRSRSQWGWYFRGGTIIGPVFVDFTLLLDPAIGGELSIGGGFTLGG